MMICIICIFLKIYFIKNHIHRIKRIYITQVDVRSKIIFMDINLSLVKYTSSLKMIQLQMFSRIRLDANLCLHGK